MLDRTLLAVVACFALGCPAGPPQPEAAHEEEHADEHETPERLTLSAEAHEAAGISVAPVELRVLAPAVRVTGTLAYDERRMAIATARIGGRITRVVADFGQAVAAGEALAWIDSPELGAAQADYSRAASMVRLRAAEYERAQLLLEGQAISRGELLRREAEWRAAQAEQQTAERKLHILGLTQADVAALVADGAAAAHVYAVRTPIAGAVTERNAVPGRVVAADEELFTIADLGSLWLFLQVFEKDLPSVTEGAVVTLTCESHPEDSFRGTIDFVGQVLDPHSRTVRARAVIDNPEGRLKPGMFTYATVEPGAADPAVPPRLAVPLAALADVGGQAVVFVLTEPRSYEMRSVVVGEGAGDWVEVRSGLTAGETIAVTGVFTLKSEAQKGGLEEHHH